MGFLFELLVHFLLELLMTPLHYLFHVLVERKH